MTNPIVVGTDGSPPAERAVEWAAAEATRRRCPLHVVYAVRPAECTLHSGPWDIDLLAEAGEHFLLRATELVVKTAPDVEVTRELMFEAPGFALRERAGGASEVVVGHRGRGGFAGLLLGSTSLSLAGRTPCPLVVVRGGTGEERDEVVAGVDLRESGHVLEYAFETAASRGAWVRAVHAWEVPPTLLDGRYPVSVREALTAAQSRLAEAVGPWRARYPEVRVVEETPSGQPVRELVNRSTRAERLVVGSHRHGGGPHIGSVSHGVIHHADCPVTVIGPHA
ncbi:universal stress protein [Actinomadura sp. DC4]|uniref:universal stress protein n=1 Tax=Actinomadura sp. DC4 TaxID=3055069 RepID=UPI0025B258F8|nr:universal stress protein [Actinomadura sp. DC4]MDN3354189.1 universal stress protein [Actinomadura sp. DC4]